MRVKGLLSPRVLLILVAVLVALVGGWYAHKNTSKTSGDNKTAASSAEKDLSTYKNDKFGVQFTYPVSWGSPTFVEAAPGEGQTGNIYLVRFPGQSKGNNQINVSMQLYSHVPGAVSKESIQSIIKQAAKTNFSAYDSSSYAFIGKLDPENSSTLDAYQIVDVAKSKIDAAKLSYAISGNAKDCPNKGAFPKEPNSNCVTRSDYDTVNTVLKSIKSL